MIKPILTLRNVTKKYNSFTAVDNVSFSIVAGEIFGFVGPNGAGKSTTIKMICGLAYPTSGDIIIDGKHLHSSFEKNLEKIGAFIETPDMYGYLSGLDNLKMFAHFYGKQAVKRIPDIVRLVGLEKRIKDKVSTYSLGMKQRLGIAQSLLNLPQLLILDEPTNGLDPNGIIEVRNIIKDLAKKHKMAIMISSHNLSELELLCDTIAIINRGKIISYKSKQQIQDVVNKAQKVRVKVDYPHYAGRKIEEKYGRDVEVFGNTIMFQLAEHEIASALSHLLQNNLTVFGIEKITKSLEQLFIEIIKKDSSTTSIF